MTTVVVFQIHEYSKTDSTSSMYHDHRSLDGSTKDDTRIIDGSREYAISISIIECCDVMLMLMLRLTDITNDAKTIGLFSGTVLNVRKHIFERKQRKSSRNFSSIVNK